MSESWIGVTRFELLNKDPQEGQCGLKARLRKKKSYYKTLYIFGQQMVQQNVENISATSHQLMGIRKPKLDAAREQRGKYSLFPKMILIRGI